MTARRVRRIMISGARGSRAFLTPKRGQGVRAPCPTTKVNGMDSAANVKAQAWIARVLDVWADIETNQAEPLAARGLAHMGSGLARLGRHAQTWRELWARATPQDILLATHDAAGEVVGARLWCATGERLAPPASSGLATRGAVLLNAAAVAWWRDGAEVDAVWIAEGEPDWATATLAGLASGLRVAVVGIYSGAWAPEMGARCEGLRVGILSDRDKAGARYAADIRRSLPASATAYRWGPDEDINDLWRRTQDIDAVISACEGGVEMPAAPTTEEDRWDWSDDKGAWVEREGWLAAKERERAWAEAQARGRADGVEAGDAHIARAQKWAQQALERSVEFLRSAEGDRAGVIAKLAPVASMVAGGALDGISVRQAWVDAYVQGDRETRMDRARLIRDVLSYRGRQARSLEDIARDLAAMDAERARSRQGERRTEVGRVVAVPARAEAVEVAASSVDVAAWRRDVSAAPWIRPPSEVEIAERVIRWMTPPGSPAPIHDDGSLWRYSQRGIWVEVDKSEVARIVGPWDGAPIGDREKDTVRINANTISGAVKIMCQLCSREGFFAGGPRGVALADGFLRVDFEGGAVEMLPHSPDHRARWRLDATPSADRSDVLTRYLESAHEGADAAEKVQLMGEVAFAALAGIGTNLKKAILAYGEGGSGKSQFLKLVQWLVPKSARATVEPQQMGHDYHCAFLAGKALNMVTDLDGADIMREGRFKAIVHGEPVPARRPSHDVFQLEPRALHVFNCNALPPAPGATAAFWDRWLIVGFERRWTGEQRQMLAGGISEIADVITRDDPGGLLGWVIECGRALVKRGHYTIPGSSSDLMTRWRREGDSVSEWLHERYSILPVGTAHERWAGADDTYADYRDWCAKSGCSPVSKHKFKARLGVHGVPNHRVARGVIYPITKKLEACPI